jgi:ADP-ribose pyrophosphatase YjhB (NUDIX family)
MWLPHVTVANIVKRGEHLLMVEEYDNERLVLNQPAGHLEEHENLIEAVKRETLEESCWNTRTVYALGVTMSRTDAGITYIRHTFVSEALSFDAEAARDDDIVDIHWMLPNEIRAAKERLRSQFVLQDLNRFERGVNFSIADLYGEHTLSS